MSAGRPEIPESERRSYIVRFVVTGAELRAIRRAAKMAGKTISEYLRACAVAKK